MNRNISQSQFKLVSNMKDKPNAQGTLFTPMPSARTPESRQPRGYSPERYEAVGKATDMGRRNRGPGTYMGHEHGGSSMLVYGGHAGTLANAWAAVARSTVPLKDLERPDKSKPKSNENPDLSIGVTQAEYNEHALGVYKKPGSTALTGEGHITLTEEGHTPKMQKLQPRQPGSQKRKRMPRDKEAESTVIHEIGHHVDRNSPYSSPREQGRAEGFADKYAAEHARLPGYKRRKAEVASEPHRWTNKRDMNWGESESFKQNYNYTRHGNTQGQLSPYQFETDRTYPKGHVKGQLPLISKGWSGTEQTPYWRLADFE